MAHVGFFEIFSLSLAGLYALVRNYGVAIILLTIIVRLILLPLSRKQIKSMREMQKIQPEVKKLQAKYKGDRQKLNEEMMKLYKEHGVNPFGGCLPLVAQMPVFIGLFRVLRTPLNYLGYHLTQVGSTLHTAKLTASGIMHTAQTSSFAQGLLQNHGIDINRFIGIRLDCSAASTIAKQSTDATTCIGASHGVVAAIPYLVLALLMGLTTYYQQRQLQGRQPQDPSAQQMQAFGKIMPIFLTVLAYSFPSGLVLYWLTTNMWTIGQQRFMFQTAGPAGGPVEKGTDGPAKKTSPKPQGSKPAPSSGTASGKDGDQTTRPKKPKPQPTGSKPDPNRKKKR
ncbi:MAG: YidC/Oxa1 family rane protein insertase [Actinomycetota bacterium]|nr:YidC/Oxa1 family rane protein insertase [Actinomycetota bacterium]MEA2487095.1 YidC/Oxa1 family rane protein insertase [Actinomycetota bacterium]